MISARQMRDTWIAYIKSKVSLASESNPKNYATLVDSSKQSVIDHLTEAMRQAGVTPQIVESVLQRFNSRWAQTYSNTEQPFPKLKRIYKTLYLQKEEMLNERRQQNWATTRDYLKMFFWRTIQAMSIAGVVLATGYLAKMWEIPLPLLRAVAQ